VTPPRSSRYDVLELCRSARSRLLKVASGSPATSDAERQSTRSRGFRHAAATKGRVKFSRYYPRLARFADAESSLDSGRFIYAAFIPQGATRCCLFRSPRKNRPAGSRRRERIDRLSLLTQHRRVATKLWHTRCVSGSKPCAERQSVWARRRIDRGNMGPACPLSRREHQRREPFYRASMFTE